jgi:hypothetical protein
MSEQLQDLLNTANALSFATAILIPFLTSLVVKAPTSAQWVLNLVLATASAFLAQWAASPNANHYNWSAALVQSVLNSIVTVVTHKGALAEHADGTLDALPAKLYAFPARTGARSDKAA